MPRHTTYTHARAHLAQLYDQAIDDREVVFIERRGKEPVAMLAASELESLQETAHLLRSPRNAERLLRAIARARSETLEPSSVDDLRRELGLDETP